MTGNLKERAKVLELEDLDWYMDAYMRAAQRLNDEEKRPTGINVERLQRHLQALFEKIDAAIEDERTRKQQQRAAATAINHAITDRHLPKTLRIYPDKESA